ncbi:hypothetical protein V6N13_061774 [Hibiscus sabdariffa]|uniref:Uncharacterized protein n=2 Tax=Hibiscus sabdariffa TaxID=183260 RepID=A0ABR2AML6_9ROSI
MEPHIFRNTASSVAVINHQMMSSPIQWMNSWACACPCTFTRIGFSSLSRERVIIVDCAAAPTVFLFSIFPAETKDFLRNGRTQTPNMYTL